MKLFEIFGVIEVDSKAAEDSLAETDARAKEAGSSIDNLSKAGEKMGALGEGLSSFGGKLSKGVTAPILAAGASMFGLVNNTANVADELLQSASKAGVAVEAFQEMAYWGDQNGLSQDQVEKALKRTNQRIGMARDGNEKYIDSLVAMGVNLKDIESGTLSTEDAFVTAISSLSKMKDSQEQAALAGQFFGVKMAQDLLPALQDGSMGMEEAAKVARDLGIVMSEDAANAGSDLAQQISDLKQQFGMLMADLGSELVPLFSETILPMIEDTAIPAIKSFIEWVSRLIKIFDSLPSGLQTTILTLLGLAAGIGPVILIIGKLILGVQSMIGVFTSVIGVIKVASGILMAIVSPIGIAIAAIAAIIAIGVLLYKNWEDIVKFGKKMFDGLLKTWESLKSGTKKAFGAMTDIMFKPIKKARDLIKKAIDKIKDFFKIKLEFPDVRLPKFLGGGKSDEDKPSKPKFKFFARGGYMDNAVEFARNNGTSYVGGEAGAEGIVPLEGRHMIPMAEAVAEIVKDKIGVNEGSSVVNNINVASMVVREQADIRRIAEELERMTERKNRLRGSN